MLPITPAVLGGGVYFDLTVGSNSLSITDLDVNCGYIGLCADESGLQVYTKAGTSFGNETNMGLWTLASTCWRGFLTTTSSYIKEQHRAVCEVLCRETPVDGLVRQREPSDSRRFWQQSHPRIPRYRRSSDTRPEKTARPRPIGERPS